MLRNNKYALSINQSSPVFSLLVLGSDGTLTRVYGTLTAKNKIPIISDERSHTNINVKTEYALT